MSNQSETVAAGDASGNLPGERANVHDGDRPKQTAPKFAFLTVAMVVEDEEPACVGDAIRKVRELLGGLVTEIDIVVIANGAPGETLLALKKLVEDVPDIQVFSLARRIDRDGAFIIGMENALGDAVITMVPSISQASAIPDLIGQAAAGFDVVIASPTGSGFGSSTYERAEQIYFWAFRRLTRINAHGASGFRLMTRPVVTWLVSHDNAEALLPTLPFASGFPVHRMDYALVGEASPMTRRSFGSALAKAARLLLAASTLPMRLVTMLSVAAGLINLIYIFYVLGVAILVRDVAPGWITMSLQISGMFFLFSLLFAFVSEYLVAIHERASRRPRALVAQEFRSGSMTRRSRLNVEEAA